MEIYVNWSFTIQLILGSITSKWSMIFGKHESSWFPTMSKCFLEECLKIRIPAGLKQCLYRCFLTFYHLKDDLNRTQNQTYRHVNRDFPKGTCQGKAKSCHFLRCKHDTTPPALESSLPNTTPVHSFTHIINWCQVFCIVPIMSSSIFPKTGRCHGACCHLMDAPYALPL